MAEQGNPKAQVTVGIMYDYGHGVPQDNLKAIEWYEKAALQGVTAVQHQLGAKYFQGQGVPQDHREAARWIIDAGVRRNAYEISCPRSGPATC